jgi:phosphopantothenoylcysteine decarboxylase/phosphopantothenate--cysteine ligase
VRRGADVTLVAGPTSVTPPDVSELVRVRSAAEMRDAVMARLAAADVVVMAAAVADYQPAHQEAHKIAKTAESLTMTLTRTPDILAEIGRWRKAHGGQRPVIVGFAAETQDTVARAGRKLAAKGADLIVANDVLQEGAGFESDTNIVTLIGPDSNEPLPIQSKVSIAGLILDRIEVRLGERGVAQP